MTEFFDQYVGLINFWMGIVFSLIMLVALFLHLIDRNTDADDYVGIVVGWIIGSIICFKLGTMVIMFFIVIILPFIVLWQLRRLVFYLIDLRKNKIIEK